MRKITLFFGLLSILGCENDRSSLNNELLKLKAEKEILIIKNDSLLDKINKRSSEQNYWFSNHFDKKKFIILGINDSEYQIKKALMENVDLIPLKPVLGGEMRFENIQILSEKWLIADYSDGHIYGKSLFSFRIDENKNFEFKLIDSLQ